MDNYKVLARIGEGYRTSVKPLRTYGLVYKAIHKDTSQVVAIKQFKESDEDEQVCGPSLLSNRFVKRRCEK